MGAEQNILEMDVRWSQWHPLQLYSSNSRVELVTEINNIYSRMQKLFIVGDTELSRVAFYLPR
jgi:hypothetical protein